MSEAELRRWLVDFARVNAGREILVAQTPTTVTAACLAGYLIERGLCGSWRRHR